MAVKGSTWPVGRAEVRGGSSTGGFGRAGAAPTNGRVVVAGAAADMEKAGLIRKP